MRAVIRSKAKYTLAVTDIVGILGQNYHTLVEHTAAGVDQDTRYAPASTYRQYHGSKDSTSSIALTDCLVHK